MTLRQYEPLIRSMPVADIVFTDGTLEAVLVPWDTPAEVADVTPDGVDTYREGFRRGAFDIQLTKYPDTVSEVNLLDRHGSTESFGRARQVTNTDAGLHGVFSVLPSRRDDVAALVEMGVNAVSVEFNPLQKAPRNPDPRGVRWRDAAWLKNVAMTSNPAYVDARVLAMRSDEEAAREEAERAAARQERFADLDAWLNDHRKDPTS